MGGALLTRTPVAGRTSRGPLQHLDVTLVAASLAVAGLGILMVYSASRSGLAAEGLDPYTYLKRQSVFVAVGMAVMALTAAIDYRTYRDLVPLVYGGAVALLVLVLSPLGTEVNGAQSWFAFGSFQLQPAEFGKIAVIVALAAFCANHRGDLDGPHLTRALAIAGVPAALIFLQPDVGSMLVYAAIVMGTLLVAGARPRHIVGLTVLAVMAVTAVFSFTGLVDDYQRDRLTGFARQEADDEAGYNLAQAKTAVAAGGLTGRGLFEGTQTKLGYVPEQQTDFIFTVVGEELGFMGSATLLFLYGVITWRVWRAAQVARDLFGTLLCTGVLSLLLFQVFENIGMTVGIMPITGLPLPFLSYGGSSTIAMFTAVGIVLNVHMRRFS